MQGRFLFYQGSRMRWMQSSKPDFRRGVWPPAALFAYVRLVKKEQVRTYLARRIREEVG